jgi:hypothetical protein
MINALRTWVPGIAFYVLGAIAPALVIAMMTR